MKKLLLSMPFLLILSTVFVVDNELTDGVVSGKYFWFYASMLPVSIAALIASFSDGKHFRLSLLDMLATAFTGCVFVSALIINDVSANSTKLFVFALLFVLYFCLRLIIKTRNHGYKQNFIFFCLCIFIVLTAFIEAIWGLLQLYGFSPSQHSLFKLTGSFFNPGPYAGYLAVVFPLSLYFLLQGMRRHQKETNRKQSIISRYMISHYIISRYMPAVTAGVTCIAILLVVPAAMSRAAWLAASAGSLVVVCGCYADRFSRLKSYCKRRRKKFKLVVVVLGFVAIAGITGMYFLKKDSADGRMLMWKVTMQVIKKHPLGVGLGNFPGAYGDAQAAYFASGKATPAEEYIAGNPEYAFNEYLQITAESGIISLLFFLAVCVAALQNCFKLKYWGIAGGLVSLFVFAFFSYPFSVLPFLILLVFFLVMSDNKQDAFENTGKTLPTICMTSVLFLFVVYTLYKQYPVYEAYKKWSAEKIYYHAGLYEDAVKAYEPLYPFLNDRVEYLFDYAQSLSKSGCYAKSNDVLARAVQISCDPMFYNIMGKNYQSMKDFEQAEICFVKSAQLIPNRLYPWYLLTKLYNETGLDGKACETAKIVETKEPKVHSPAIDEMRKEVRKICKFEN